MNLTKLLAGLAVCVAFATIPASAQANPCTSGSFTGGYGYALSAAGFDGNGNVVFAALAGRLVSDGNGNISGRDTMNVAGLIVRRTYTGTYLVNAD